MVLQKRSYFLTFYTKRYFFIILLRHDQGQRNHSSFLKYRIKIASLLVIFHIYCQVIYQIFNN
jgi:hypothetical protein